MLRRVGDDFMHYDFTPASLLSDGTAITGVTGINPPVLAGDRAFDRATLLFCRYDHEDIRALARARLLDLAGPRRGQRPPRPHGASPGRLVAAPPSAAAAARRHLYLAGIITVASTIARATDRTPPSERHVRVFRAMLGSWAFDPMQVLQVARPLD